MARVIGPGEARKLDLPGRDSFDIVSAATGATGVTLRRVEIPVEDAGGPGREPHCHQKFEECIYVLSGQGTVHAASGAWPVTAGDTVLMPPGEMHMTRNTGEEPLVLLCFFPVAEIGSAG